MEKIIRSILFKNKVEKIKYLLFIIAIQAFMFFLVSALDVKELTFISIIIISFFAFTFGELAGVFFAVLVGIVFSPIGIDINNERYTAWWVIRTLSLGFSAIVMGNLGSFVKQNIIFKDKIRITDVTTDLPNRLAFIEDLKKFAEEQTHHYFTIVVISISNKKILLDTFGGNITKNIFSQFKDRYTKFAVERDIDINTYSLSESQIGFLFIENIEQDMKTKEKFEEELMRISRKNFIFDGFFTHCDSHLGLYRFSDFSDTNSSDYPIFYAEEASYVAVKQMKNLVVYSPHNHKQQTKFSKTSDILGEIDLAIRSRKMFLVYQPKIDLETGKINSVEALIRWQHPTKGFIPPNLFISQAEQSTLIENITEFVLKQATLQLKLWQRSSIFVKMAINVSAYNLLQPNFVNKVLNCLKEKGLSHESLEIEVTEGAFISDFQHVLETLTRFNDAKIKIALDDFGTGYSSFQYLQKLPIDYIKIDQSFVREINKNRESNEIVKAIIDLAHTINLKTIAEGIETLNDYEYLKNVKCDMGQGYYMAKPLTSNDFVSWYSENNGIFKPN